MDGIAGERRSTRFLIIVVDKFFRLLQIIFHGLLSVIYNGPGDALPAINNVILLDSAVTLAHKIRTKKLTSVEVVESFIDRIKQINPILNTLVDNRFNDALEDARKADNIVSTSGKTPDELAHLFPFLGVPFTVKDCISVKGVSFTGGLFYRKDLKALKDADDTARLRSAGAIPIGVTNVSELCLWWESVNKVYGRTKNPYNTNHIVGGSSGGEGCIQAAAGSAMGVGSDIGGSVRIPSFFNGIFGHKPTTGTGSRTGHYPVPRHILQQSFLVSGPMSRFCSDLKPMLKVLAGSEGDSLQLDRQVDITKLKYYYMEDDGGGLLVSRVETEIKEAIRSFVNHLKRAHGITAEKVNISSLKNSMALWFAKMKVPGPSQLIDELGNNEKVVNPWLEIAKLPLGLSCHTFPVLGLSVLEKADMPYGSAQHRHLVNKCDDLKVEMEAMLGTDGVFIYPTHPTSAPYHVEPIIKPFNVAYTAIFNVLGLPATHCPTGLDKKGLPIGFQIVGGEGQDRLTLAVAQEVEKVFGGWVPPNHEV